MGPDGVPVGWGVFTAGPALNLERDDRGKINDAATLNYEMMSIRSRDPGEYTVNLHLYNEFNDPLAGAGQGVGGRQGGHRRNLLGRGAAQLGASTR